MKRLKIKTEDDPCVIYAFTDTHFGNVGQDKKKLARHIQACKDEKAYWIHLGDWVEGITHKDKRDDVRLPSGNMKEEYAEAYQAFLPIKDQGLAILEGNHDSVISSVYGDNVETLAENLNTPYLGYGGYIDIKTPLKKITLLIHHGMGMGFLLGAKAINVHRLSHKFKADVFLMGHVHTDIRHQHPFGNKNKYYAIVPSYFNPYGNGRGTNYAVRSASYPQVTGCLRIEIGTPIRAGQSFVRMELLSE